MYNIPRIITLTTIAHINVFNFPYLPKSVFKTHTHTHRSALRMLNLSILSP